VYSWYGCSKDFLIIFRHLRKLSGTGGMRLILSFMYLVYSVYFAFRRFHFCITGLFIHVRLIPMFVTIGLCWLFGNFCRMERETLRGCSFLSLDTRHRSGKVVVPHLYDSKVPPCLASKTKCKQLTAAQLLSFSPISILVGKAPFDAV